MMSAARALVRGSNRRASLSDFWKTQRDLHEAAKLANRIEKARTEKLLTEAGR